MRFGYWPNPSAEWSDLVVLAQHAEASGWDGLWFADHFMPNARDNGGPTHESWTVLAGLAALVPRLRLGHMVSGNTYRHPAVVAKMAASIDLISGGRFILGLGAAWQENEHQAYGIPFGTTGERLRRLEEACQVVTGLLRQERTTFRGKYYQVEDAPLSPRPVQPRLPLMIGGGGEQVTLRIVARHADEWNVWGTPEVLAQKQAILDRHCAAVGRDPQAIRRTAAVMLAFDADPSASAAGGRPLLAGDGAAMRATVQRFVDVGVGELIIPDFNLGPDPEGKIAALDRFRDEVISAFR
jgi:F420-dependent oxidoreductase-like protein